MVVKAATHLHFLSPLLAAAVGGKCSPETRVEMAALVVALGKITIKAQLAKVPLGRVLTAAQVGRAATAALAVAVGQEKMGIQMVPLAGATLPLVVLVAMV